MSAPLRHLLQQGPVLAALGRVAVSQLRPRRSGVTPDTATPGPWITAELPPRSDALVRDYLRHVGSDPAFHRDRVPAHLFPQWGFPLAARTIADLPYPLAKVVNGGCRITQSAPLPAGAPLLVRARLESIDDDGRRAILVQRIVTGTREHPDAVDAEIRAIVPLGKPPGERGAPTRERAIVPADAREIAFFALDARSGRDFATLTGDVNPIHWIPAYARAAGFRACILHGFATLARAIAAIDRSVFAGDPLRLARIDVRFTRPLVLPARVGVYVRDEAVWVGDAPGGAAYLEGEFLGAWKQRRDTSAPGAGAPRMT